MVNGVQFLAEAVSVWERYESNYFPLSYEYGGARGVMVIVVGNGHGDTSSNPGRD